MCRIFRGVPRWGGGPGPSGYSHGGAYGAHPQREPRYHTKELGLDALAAGARVGSEFGPLIDSSRRQVPYGDGSVRGVLLFLGESPEEAKRISAGLTYTVIMNLFNEVSARRSQFDRKFNAIALVRDLNDLQFNFCEGRQFWTVSASHLRSFLSKEKQPTSGSADVLLVMPEVMPEAVPCAAPPPSAEEQFMRSRTYLHGRRIFRNKRKSNDSLTAEAFVSSMSEELHTKCFACMNYYKIIVQSCGTRRQTNEAKRRKLAELVEENKHRRR